MKSIVVLISGSGSNLQSIIDHCNSGCIKGVVSLVISNNTEAFGLERAKNHDIPIKVIEHKNFNDRETFDEELVSNIKKEDPDLIVLAGFMRILTKTFTNAFINKVINIHPSLLPKYPGLNTHEQVLNNKDVTHGITIHYVTEELDGGPIIAQGSMRVDKDMDKDNLINKIHEIEHDLYPKVIAEILDGKVELQDSSIHYNESSSFKENNLRHYE